MTSATTDPCRVPDLPRRARILRCRRLWTWPLAIGSALLALLGVVLTVDDRAFGSDVDAPALLIAGGLLGLAFAEVAGRTRPRGIVRLEATGLHVEDDGGEVEVLWGDVEAVRLEHGPRRSAIVVERRSREPLILVAARLGSDPHTARNLIDGWRCAALGLPYVRRPEPIWEGWRTVRALSLGALAVAVTAAVAAPLGFWGLVGFVAIPLLGLYAFAVPPALRALPNQYGRTTEHDELLGAVRVPLRNIAASVAACVAVLLGAYAIAASVAGLVSVRDGDLYDGRPERLLEDRTGVEVDLHCPSLYGGDRLVCTGARDGVRYTVVAPRGDCDPATLTCQTWNWDRMTVRRDGRS